MTTDHRSPDSAAYRKYYKTARWRRIRDAQLSKQPLCEWCIVSEVIEPATVVHHSEGGHKGDEQRFWNGPFVSLCKSCHDSHGKREDLGQAIIRFDAQGWPL